MSNKNIGIGKYKWDGQPIKTSNSGIFKEHPKIQTQYSPKNLPKDSPKNFKSNLISRHASQEEFKRFTQSTHSQIDHHSMGSAEDEYQSIHSSHGKLQYMQPKRAMFTPTPESHYNRNYQKDNSSATSIEHSNNRRMSPSTSPLLFRSKPKLVIKQTPKPKTLSRNNFKILKKLGEGKFGKVYLVREIYTGFMMAMKVLEKKKIIQDNILEQFIRQLKIQAFLNHPNIIDVYGFFHDEANFYTLLELGSDGQLYNIIAQHKNLTEEATSFITKNLLEAVKCMHQNKILHRDIKPENIVLIMGNVKLCDFGWAVNKVKKEELRSTFCGTPLYLSPQLLKGYKYDEKVDLWAIGILAYELLIGCSPFQINEQQDLYKILTQQVKFPKGRKISQEFQEFTHCILNKNPKERLPSTELLRLQFIRKYEQFETCEQLCS